MKQVARRIDQPRDFFRCQDRRKPAGMPRSVRIRQILSHRRALECPHVEEPQRGYTVGHSAHTQLSLLQQMNLVLPNLVRTEMVQTLVNKAPELLHRL